MVHGQFKHHVLFCLWFKSVMASARQTLVMFTGVPVHHRGIVTCHKQVCGAPQCLLDASHMTDANLNYNGSGVGERGFFLLSTSLVVGGPRMCCACHFHYSVPKDSE